MTYDEETDVIRVLGTMPDSPAEKAGIKGGDLIFQVDDLIITADTYYDGVNNIRGEEGTDVKIRVKRGDEILEFTITRQKIQENNVTSDWKTLDNNQQNVINNQNIWIDLSGHEINNPENQIDN